MKNFIALAVFLTVFVITGCAGTDFKKLEGEQVAIGVDSPETIKAKLGKPFQEGVVTKNEKQFTTMNYAYANTTGDAAYKGVTAARGQGFYFYDNRLVGTEFTSTWALDSTDFDEKKIPLIKKGVTTIDEVVTILGKPGGEYTYPLTVKENEKAKVYLYNQTKGSAFSLKFHQKLLVINYDQSGMVTNVDYIQQGVE